MTGINFKRDYGYPAASPAWFVMCPDMTISPRPYSDRESAEAAAAEMAHGKPGHTYHIVATVATVSTEVKVIGQNFDPTRKIYPDVEAPPVAPAPVDEDAPL